MSQKFYVTIGLNRNFILGRDWPKQNGVRMYFDLGILRTGRTYKNMYSLARASRYEHIILPFSSTAIFSVLKHAWYNFHVVMQWGVIL